MVLIKTTDNSRALVDFINNNNIKSKDIITIKENEFG